MATATEATFWAAVTAAAGVRQVAYAAAQATYAAAGFTPGARATYIAAAVTADIAYDTAVNSAATTAAVISPLLPAGRGPISLLVRTQDGDPTPIARGLCTAIHLPLCEQQSVLPPSLG
jgi:hypothetical protein